MSRPSPSEYEAAGLYDPAAPNAADRLALLEFLAGNGVTLERMVAAAHGGSLTGAAADGVLRPGERLTLAEVAELAGMAPKQVERVHLASGFPVVDHDERVFVPSDADLFAAVQIAAEFFGEAATLRFVRVMGSSLGRTAEAAVWLFLENVEQPIVTSAKGELALAKANFDAVGMLAAIPEMMDRLFRFHAHLAIRRIRAARAGMSTFTTARLAVGFVDLVGFTPLAAQAGTDDLARLIDDFESVAHDVVTQRDGRVVKMIGDEVMFVTLDPRAACDIALELVEEHGRQDTTVTPRGGVAVGELLIRGGDYHGRTVNLASRIGDLAVPHEVLVSPELRAEVESASTSFRFHPAGRRLLKGFDEPVELFSLTRAGDEVTTPS